MRSLILASVIGILSASVPVQHQDRDGGETSIAVNVHLAVFNVTVTDNKGRHVPGMRESDFRVLEEGQPQNIRLFRAEDAPATIGLIMDNSGSMRTKRADVVQAAFGFVNVSNPEDEMFLVNFNENVFMGLPQGVLFTSDFRQIRAALLRIIPNGRTALYDALVAGLNHLKVGTRDRKALVVLSDGGDNASHYKLDDILKLSDRSSATIYAIGIYDDTDTDRNPRALRKIAEASGGHAYFPESLGALTRIWSEVSREIRSQYTIGFVPSQSGKGGLYRNVKIVASKGGQELQVTTRSGYAYP